ncbi:fatty acid synthase-like, partial [Frankliniella occidentalis]|uniref:Fatty acid synthase-like n=1 Tax=Frankliniella occidentalis TaxID=133901 RepID=A0A9C6TY95_FRAOC
MVVAMETGVIPATINFQEPNSEATGLVAGRLQVVEKNTPLHLSEDSVLAVHTMALSSMVGHAVLGGNPRGPGRVQDPADHLPRLITFSARNEEAAARVVNKIQSAPFHTNYYRLLQDVFSDDIRGYTYRGYVICPSVGNDTLVAPLEKRPVWFVYSGMGSQWAGMGTALMKIPVFAETIDRLHAVLEPRGMDLKAILTETGPTAFDNILKSFVGITACQVALTNVLTAVGVVPEGMVGHSAGELGCAYADGCFTEEQAILAAFARGKASNAVPLIKGKMAAIGLGYQDVLPRLPPTIDVACHNSSTSCTLSGPAQDVESFVRKLSDEGVFARAVNVSDIAYHSRYIQHAAPHLLQHLKEVIPQPKPRSSRWITTSVPVDERDSELAKFCSAEYQTNNLLSPVLFEEALQLIPERAVLIEVAPHGLLQAILKRALPDNYHIPLTQRSHPDPLRLLLAAIGRMSFASVSPKVSALYPDVDFPVPRGTPSVAPLVLYDTDESTNSDMMHLKDYWREAGASLNVRYHVKVSGSRIYPLSEELVLMYESALARKADGDEISFHVSLQDILVKQWIPISPNDDSFLEAHFMTGTTETQLVYIDEND